MSSAVDRRLGQQRHDENRTPINGNPPHANAKQLCKQSRCMSSLRKHRKTAVNCSLPSMTNITTSTYSEPSTIGHYATGAILRVLYNVDNHAQSCPRSETSAGAGVAWVCTGAHGPPSQAPILGENSICEDGDEGAMKYLHQKRQSNTEGGRLYSGSLLYSLLVSI